MTSTPERTGSPASPNRSAPATSQTRSPRNRPRRSYNNVIIGVALFAAIVIGIGVLSIAVLLPSKNSPTSPGATNSPASEAADAPTARSVVDQLATAKLVSAKSCSEELANAPATSQQRCALGGGRELIVIAFADASGVQARVDAFASQPVKTRLVRGRTWIINVGDLAAKKQDTVSRVLNGIIMTVGS